MQDNGKNNLRLLFTWYVAELISQKYPLIISSLVKS
jgi:hypothetical protein